MDVLDVERKAGENASKKIDRKNSFDRLLGTPTRRRAEKPGGERPGKQG